MSDFVFDFNGTVYRPRDEGPTYKAIANAVKADCMPGLQMAAMGPPNKISRTSRDKNEA